MLAETGQDVVVSQDDMAENAKDASEFLKALAHETRLMILCCLVQGEKSVSELEAILDIRQPAVSQQLARLRADRLVSPRRDGKTIFYSISRPETREIIDVLYSVFCKTSTACAR